MLPPGGAAQQNFGQVLGQSRDHDDGIVASVHASKGLVTTVVLGRVNLGGMRFSWQRRYSPRRIWYFRTQYTPEPLLNEDYTCQLPTEAVIEIGNVCNLSCTGCPTGMGKKMPKGIMSYADFQVVFRKIMPYTSLFHLFNFGEPFLNKDVLRIVALSSKHGILTHLDSNLTVRDFSDNEAEAIVRSGLSRLVASIDGGSQETYQRYRLRGNFARAVRNLGTIQRARERLGSGTPDLVWKFLINAINEHEMDHARAMAGEIGVAISFELMDTDNEDWKSSYHREAEAAQQTTNETCRGPKRALSVAINKLTAIPPLYEWCLQPFRMLIVNFDGNVFPCCNVFGEEYSLGNLHHESLEQIWNGDKARRCRQFIHNFGPRQSTGSICETLPCPVGRKFLE